MCYSAESADSLEYVKRAMGVIPLNVPVSLIETHSDKIAGNAVSRGAPVAASVSPHKLTVVLACGACGEARPPRS